MIFPTSYRKSSYNLTVTVHWLPSRNFSGGGAKSIVIQIYFVFLLFSDQISGWTKSPRGGGKLPQGGAPVWKKASTIRLLSTNCSFHTKNIRTLVFHTDLNSFILYFETAVLTFCHMDLTSS